MVYSQEFQQYVLINLRKISGLPKGFSDLIFIGDRNQGYDMAFIEMKTLTGRSSPEQTNFQSRMQALGYDAFVIRSPEEVEMVVKKR